MLGETIEWHRDTGTFKFRGQLRAQAFEQFDTHAMTQHGATGGVEVGTSVGRGVHILIDTGGAGVGGIHLTAQGLELGQGDITGAALDVGSVYQYTINHNQRNRAFFSQFGTRQNIGSGVQIALGVASNQFGVLGEGHITLNDAGAHAGGCHVGLLGVLRELQRGAPVTDGDIALLEGTLGATLQFPL